jgi:uncharacterized protein YigA (DUF484 family)
MAESAERHSQDLKKVNDKLRELISSLRTDRERHTASRAGATAPAQVPEPAHALRAEEPPTSAPAVYATGAEGVDLEKKRLNAEVVRLRIQVEDQRRETDELRNRLAEVEEENRRVCDEAMAVQEQTAAIANLYAALYRLHGSLDREEVLTGIQEIVINMIGSEELAVYELSPDGQYLDLVRSFGIESKHLQRLPLGSGTIGRCASSGELFVAEGLPSQDGVSACVPLKMESRVVGAVAVFKLLGQKAGITPADREIFELLQAHAARSLALATHHEAQGRANR